MHPTLSAFVAPHEGRLSQLSSERLRLSGNWPAEKEVAKFRFPSLVQDETMFTSLRHRVSVPASHPISSLPVRLLGRRAHTEANTTSSLTRTSTPRPYSQRTAAAATTAAAAAVMGKVERITMFKIPREADRDRALEQYRVLKQTAVKVCVYLCML